MALSAQEYQRLSATELAAAFASGMLSAVEITEAALAATDATEKDVHAFIQLTPELACAAAESLDRARTAGELYTDTVVAGGASSVSATAATPAQAAFAAVPFAIKDNMNMKGTRTTCASRMLEHYESSFTATCVQRLLDAHGIPIGKLNMDEFAFGSSTETSAFFPTNNPWDFGRVPGGSSGGSAAAVAARQVPIALGSDTGGSIRQPAAFCGVAGLKPSYGVVSRYGVVAFGSSLDQVGPLARSVEDLALCMNALTQAGKDPFDSTNQACVIDFLAELKRPLENMRVGVVPELLELKAMSSEIIDAVKRAEQSYKDAGARVVDIELPHMQAAISAYYVIGPCEAFSNLARFDGIRYGYQAKGYTNLAEQSAHSRAEGFGLEAKRRQMLGAYLLASGVYERYYVAAQKVRTLITEDYAEAFKHCDVLLLPTTPSPAFKHGEINSPTQMYASDLFTISSNIAGNASLSLPFGLGAKTGLPVAVQLQSPAFFDARLLQYARVLEAVAPSLGEPALLNCAEKLYHDLDHQPTKPPYPLDVTSEAKAGERV